VVVTSPAEERPTVAPPVVAVMVVHEPGPWFADVLSGLAAQEYPDFRLVAFLTGGTSAGVGDDVRAQFPSALVRQVDGNPGFGPVINQVLNVVDGRDGFFDCTEHAVLLAALLRAEGIPARVASGLVYVPDLSGAGPGWGWHLWTQALVEPKGGGGPMWTDFDATVAGEGRGYHVAHILVASSDLAGGATDPAFSRAVSLIGGLRVTVKEGAEDKP